MSIRKSASAEVESLVAGLRAHPADGPRREAALARLAVIGQRAVMRLLAALEAAQGADERAALCAALERIPDARSVPALLRILEGGNDGRQESPRLRSAAVRAARPLLTLSPQGTAVLERLTVLALDSAEPLPLRRAALEALSDLPARTIEPVRQRLRDDPDPAVRALADGGAVSVVEPSTETPVLPEDPGAALEAVGRLGGGAPLPVLHALLAPVRAREGEGGRRRTEWTGARGAIHLALARRGSRVGLYDLREAFETPALHPLPPEFIVAVRLIGDGTCLEPIARAWLLASTLRARGTDGWAEDLRGAFRELLGRERAAARRKLVQRLEQKWGAGVRTLAEVGSGKWEVGRKGKVGSGK